MAMTLKTTSRNLEPPKYPGDVGYDLPASETVVVHPGQFKEIPTGVHVELPEGTWGLIAAKSSANVSGRLIVLFGVIDNGYRGELKAFVHNVHETEPVIVWNGKAVVQLIVMPMSVPPVEYVDALSDTARGSNGFGSSGNGI